MRVIDLDQMITVPVVDESANNKVFNTDMTIADFFKVGLGIDVSEISFDAIPVEWLNNKANNSIPLFQRHIQALIKEWESNNE